MTVPEPACDIAAQIAALRDPTHPKDAVWLAGGAGLPLWLKGGDLLVVRFPDGVLITSSQEKVARLGANPNDDTRAEVLGYAEPKSRIAGTPVVVQALNDYGSVVLEMAVSAERVSAAMTIAHEHGELKITSLEDALMRRLVLLGLEG